MLCKFCQENVRGTPCQSASQSAKCVNNRDNDWPDDDRNQCQAECQKQCEIETQTEKHN